MRGQAVLKCMGRGWRRACHPGAHCNRGADLACLGFFYSMGLLVKSEEGFVATSRFLDLRRESAERVAAAMGGDVTVEELNRMVDEISRSCH